MEVKISKETSRILDFARDEALRTGCRVIGAGHIMLAIIRHASNPAAQALTGLEISLDELKHLIDSDLFSPEPIPYEDAVTIKPGKDARRVLSIAAYETLKEGGHTVTSRHLLLALARSEYSPLTEYFYSHGLDYDIIRQYLDKESGTLPDGKNPALNIRSMMGALGEQISNLIGSAGANTNYLS